jgi:SAM-dependent methyltransferase
MNPWLRIPAADYEGHMSSPAVGQFQALSDLFAAALAEFRPPSVAVVGCATGNGFEHVDPWATKRLVGIDINPSYLTIARERHSARLPQLELLQQDCASAAFQMAPVEMVFAALIFEYVPLARTLANISRSLLPGGILVSGLQLPSDASGPVTKTAFTSLELLSDIMTLVDPEDFKNHCRDNRLDVQAERILPLKQGKAIYVGTYRKA